jgi:hydroxymethylpyrimidine/phosphomethylpyrimidine kinase
MKDYTCVLTIAGSDSCAGAGIQADLKTFAALGCYGLSVITALTAQNTHGVQAIHSVPSCFVKAQLDSIYQDIDVAAVKIGMLHRVGIIKTVADYYKDKDVPLIVDPVMVAKGGSILLEKKTIKTLEKHLLPIATLLTPNIPEAEVLLGKSLNSFSDMEKAATALSKQGPNAVLIKGGHMKHKLAKDCLYIKTSDEIHWFESSRIKTNNTHGTGCTFSSAITALLAQGYTLVNAIMIAKQYLFSALKAGSNFRLGHGNGPVQHFCKLW